MKKYFAQLSILTVSTLIILSSCTKPTTDVPVTTPPDTTGTTHHNPDTTGTTDPGNSAGNTVVGYVRDTHGNPIPNCSVWAENGVFDNWTEATTDANGKYTITGVIEGGWNVYAWNTVTYDGQTYHLRMGMPNASDYDAFAGNAKQAVERDFVWKLDGIIPDRDRDDLNSYGYFGGSISFSTLDADFNSFPAGVTVTVTCTPVAGAVLFDGSPATTVVKTFTTKDTSPATLVYLIHDIAQSHYNLTASCVIDGKTHKIGMGWRNDDTHHDSLDNFSFSPDGDPHGSYESGLKTQNDNLIYMTIE